MSDIPFLASSNPAYQQIEVTITDPPSGIKTKVTGKGVPMMGYEDGEFIIHWVMENDRLFTVKTDSSNKRVRLTMSYAYRDDTPAEDMVARDHYIKASILAHEAGERLEKWMEGFGKAATPDNIKMLTALANVHAKLAENYVNGQHSLLGIDD